MTDDNNVEVKTQSFPVDHDQVALIAAMEASMKPIMPHFLSSNTAKIAGREENLPRVKTQTRKDFNTPLNIRRRLVRVLMSSCAPLKEAMREAGPKMLIETIRDSMIVYYDCYKSPPIGFLHGGKLQIFFSVQR